MSDATEYQPVPVAPWDPSEGGFSHLRYSIWEPLWRHSGEHNPRGMREVAPFVYKDGLPDSLLTQARFLACQESGLVLVVEDIGFNNRSVINDAERVVERLRLEFEGLLCGWNNLPKRIVARELGRDEWTGFRVKDEQFAGFVPIDATTRDEAVKVARTAEEW